MLKIFKLIVNAFIGIAGNTNIGGSNSIIYVNTLAYVYLFCPEKSLPVQLSKFNVIKSVEVELGPKYRLPGIVTKNVNTASNILAMIKYLFIFF